MRNWSKALIVPVVVWTLWLLPNESPSETLAAGTNALADTAPLVVASVEADLPAATADNSSNDDPNQGADFVDSAPQRPVAAVLAATSTEARSENIETAPPPSTTTSTAAPTPTNSAPPALASTTSDDDEQLSLGDQALSRVAFPWRESFPDWQVVFRGPRSGIRALTFPQEKRVEIFIRSSDTVETLHRVFAHELGHIVDVEWNSDDDRQRWINQRRLSPDAPWWPSAESPDFATGAGDFAEAFAVWETGVTTRSTVAGQPTAEDLALLQELSRG